MICCRCGKESFLLFEDAAFKTMCVECVEQVQMNETMLAAACKSMADISGVLRQASDVLVSNARMIAGMKDEPEEKGEVDAGKDGLSRDEAQEGECDAGKV